MDPIWASIQMLAAPPLMACWWPGKSVEGGLKPWVPVPTWEPTPSFKPAKLQPFWEWASDGRSFSDSPSLLLTLKTVPSNLWLAFGKHTFCWLHYVPLREPDVFYFFLRLNIGWIVLYLILAERPRSDGWIVLSYKIWVDSKALFICYIAYFFLKYAK